LVSLGIVVAASGCSSKDDDGDSGLDGGSDPVVVDGAADSDGGGDGDEDAAADAGLDAQLDAARDGAAELDGSGDAGGPDGSELDAASLDATADANSGDGGLVVMDATLDAAGDAQLDAGGGADAETDAGPDAAVVVCPGNNGGLTLPPGFCATRYAENVPAARHLVVSPAGDLFVATAPRTGTLSSFVGLRDTDGDGVAETRETVGNLPGNGIDWENGYLYFAANDRVLRYALPSGSLRPAGDPELVVGNLPADPDHSAKTVVVVNDVMFVNIGSATNSCQVDNRAPRSPGIDPCPELSTRSGVWRFAANTLNQSEADGVRFATGTRNANALAYRYGLGKLFAAQNSRDQLFENWPEAFTAEDDVRLPAEGIFYLQEGDNYGWPYCYYDAQAQKYFLAPEYGGDGETVGARCENLKQPVATLPAHWAPLGMAFYENDAFPAHYRNGAFIANHGSRFAPNAAEPLPGYNVVFVPFQNEHATGPYERFAEGFAGSGRPLPESAEHRPVGVAVASDGALFVSDDKGGVIWRISYQGP
jgi:glucose/arabinose dehydrogenase